MSQHSFGVATGGLGRGMVLCRNMTSGVATTAQECGTEACRDRAFSVAIGFGFLVSRHSLGVVTGCGHLVSRQGRAD